MFLLYVYMSYLLPKVAEIGFPSTKTLRCPRRRTAQGFRPPLRHTDIKADSVQDEVYLSYEYRPETRK
jgi:hypothetical protein